VSSPTKWDEAQEGERAFHCTDDGYRAVRRKFEHQKRQQYAAIMMIDELSAKGKRVADLGAGPQSLMLSFAEHLAAGSVAVDPLTFLPEDEAVYAAASIERHIGPAEGFVPAAGVLYDEVWIYNCLQHVQDPAAVCAVAASITRGAVRIFEYVDVPQDELHLHTLTADDLRAAFAGMNCYSHCSGKIVIGNGGAGVSFYSACFLHRSIDPEHWL